MTRHPVNYDVLVVGAGPSGIAAAVSAARAGCTVLLVEMWDQPGGVAVQAPLHRVCGLYGTQTGHTPSLLNEGLVTEIVEGLGRLRPAVSKPVAIGKVHVLPFRAADLETILAGVIEAENSLKVLYHARPVSVTSREGRIHEVRIEINGEAMTVSATVLIDATGNAAFSALAGAPLLAAAPENRQLGGFVVQVQGCRGDDMTAVSVPYLLHKAAGEGIVPPSFRFTAWEPEIGSPDRGFLKFSVPPAGDLPPALVREFSERAIAYLRAHLPAFAAASVERTSGRVFAREGSRIQGEYVLTEEDVLNGRKFDDGLVKNAWPIEFWDPRRGPVYKYLIEGDYYEIPFRCLRPVGMLNLLAAGMCLSSTQAAHASARVVGPCIALGEKAGQAAAMFAGTGEWKPDRLSHS